MLQDGLSDYLFKTDSSLERMTQNYHQVFSRMDTQSIMSDIYFDRKFYIIPYYKKPIEIQ